MTTKAEREAAYQALAKLGVPIPPKEIDAVLEAAEGARESDARAAPMPEEVKASMTSLSELFAEPETDEGYQKNWADVVAHIDDLTRKVAEAGGLLRAWVSEPDETRPPMDVRTHAFLAGQPLSRPQETDAVLAAATAVADSWARVASDPDAFRPGESRELLNALYRAVHGSRPSPGPATETDRKNGKDVKEMFGFEIARKIEDVRLAAYDDSGNEPSRSVLNRAIDSLYNSVGALLASVRPKQEGV